VTLANRLAYLVANLAFLTRPWQFGSLALKSFGLPTSCNPQALAWQLAKVVASLGERRRD